MTALPRSLVQALLTVLSQVFVLLGRQGTPATARVLAGAGLAEPALLHAWLATHGHLQRHDPEGERQERPRAARLGGAGHCTPGGLLLGSAAHAQAPS